QQRVFPANPSPTHTSPSLLSNTQACPEKLVRRMSQRVEKEAIARKWVAVQKRQALTNFGRCSIMLACFLTCRGG
ncbi:hypothetical protein K443DRAFT_98429, partial [Laccaria amethystina LaAM-08-1]